MKPLFKEGLTVVNVGLAAFGDNVVAAGGDAIAVEWQPPAGGDPDAAWALAQTLADPRVDALIVLFVPPVVVLWIEERPVAVRVRTVVAISRFPPEPRLVSMLEADCLAAGLAVERMPEAGLWRLFAHPPRPRLAY